MKNKILNAINEGLLNAISADIEDQNIDFNRPSIDNEYIQGISLEELYQKFLNNPESIFEKFNTKNAVSLIFEDNAEFSIYEYKKLKSELTYMHPLFIKISNDDLQEGKNDILIYLYNNHFITDSYAWQTGKKQMQDDMYLVSSRTFAAKTYDGFAACKRILKNKSKDVKIPALNYCMKSRLKQYDGYLPAIGQLQLLAKYLPMINYILNVFGLQQITMNANDKWWSSTEYGLHHAWYLHGYGTDASIKDVTYFYVFPFFKFKNK